MGTWCMVLSDGETYGELDGCSLIFMPDSIDDINDADAIRDSINVMAFAVLQDGRLMVELINPSDGVTDYTITLPEPDPNRNLFEGDM